MWLVTGKEGNQRVAPREERNPIQSALLPRGKVRVGWDINGRRIGRLSSPFSSRLLVWRPVRTTRKVCLDCWASGFCRNHNATQPPGERFITEFPDDPGNVEKPREGAGIGPQDSRIGPHVCHPSVSAPDWVPRCRGP